MPWILTVRARCCGSCPAAVFTPVSRSCSPVTSCGSAHRHTVVSACCLQGNVCLAGSCRSICRRRRRRRRRSSSSSRSSSSRSSSYVDNTPHGRGGSGPRARTTRSSYALFCGTHLAVVQTNARHFLQPPRHRQLRSVYNYALPMAGPCGRWQPAEWRLVAARLEHARGVGRVPCQRCRGRPPARTRTDGPWCG